MQRLLQLYLTGQFGRFLLAGGCAAVAQFLSRFVFEPMLGFPGSLVAAFGVGLVTAFFLNRRYVFPTSGKAISTEMAWFFLFNALAFPVVIGAALALDAWVFGRIFADGLSKALAHAVAIVLPVLANFVAHKFVTFGPRP